jgi:hypothetical protein
MPRSQVKDEKTYRELRKHGESKEKSARIANASAATSRKKVAAKGGKSPSYTDQTKQELLKRAREIGIKGRSSMSKDQLVRALRNH